MDQTFQTTIYIGLNDSETGDQKYDTEKYLSILKTVCLNYKVGFSVHVINGGYFHEDGHFTEERALQLSLLNVPKHTIEEIAKDLCAFFNQESVMVTSSENTVYYVKESL